MAHLNGLGKTARDRMSRQLKMAAPDVNRQVRHRPFLNGQRKFRRSRILAF